MQYLSQYSKLPLPADYTYYWRLFLYFQPTMKSIFIIMVIAIVWLINQINGSPHSSTAPSNSNALKILSEAYSGPSNRGIGHRNWLISSFSTLSFFFFKDCCVFFSSSSYLRWPNELILVLPKVVHVWICKFMSLYM